MEYISIFILPAALIIFLWAAFGVRDSYRKGRVSLTLVIFAVAMFATSYFYIIRNGNGDWEVSNAFAWVAVFGILISIISVGTMKFVKPKRYEKEFELLEQEVMYDTGCSLEQAYYHRVIKWKGKTPSKVSTDNIELAVVDKQKNLLPHLKKEISDIVSGENMGFYEYSLTRVDPLKKSIDEIEKGLSPFYKSIFKIANENLTQFSDPIPFKRAMELNNNIVEYAILYTLEKAKSIKNTPLGNLGSLVNSLQDEHMLGACSSLGFTSVGRYGIGIYVGYKKYWENQNNISGENNV